MQPFAGKKIIPEESHPASVQKNADQMIAAPQPVLQKSSKSACVYRFLLKAFFWL
jgi:hypothetical protein